MEAEFYNKRKKSSTNYGGILRNDLTFNKCWFVILFFLPPKPLHFALKIKAL